MESSGPEQQNSTLQLIAAVVSLIGILLTGVAAIRASNPTPQIVVTLAAAILLLATVARTRRG